MDEIKSVYLTRFGPLTDKGFIQRGKGGGVIIDVQQPNVDWNTAALTRVIWKANTGTLSCLERRGSLPDVCRSQNVM